MRVAAPRPEVGGLLQLGLGARPAPAGQRIAELFDFVVCSAEVGRRKPHPSIFELVVDHAGVGPDRILFVGDNWTEDVGGATAAGMRTIRVATATACAVAGDHSSVPCIAELAEQLTVVQRARS